MSSLIGHESGGNGTPTEGVRGIQEKSPANADVASDGSEEGKIKDPLPVGPKRKRSPSSEEQCSPKRTKPVPELGTGSLRNMRHPSERIPCVVSVDQHKPIGSFYTAGRLRGYVVIDAGRYGPPTISLGFRNSAAKTSKDRSRNTWDTQSNVRGQ